MTLRMGRCSTRLSGEAAGGQGTLYVDVAGPALRWARREVVMVFVVLVRICKVFGGGLGL